MAPGKKVAMTEWRLDFVPEEYGHKQGDEAAVQEWEDGEVVREQCDALY